MGESDDRDDHLVAGLLRDVDGQRLDSLATRLADDVVVVVNIAGNPPVIGVADVIAGQREFLGLFRSLRHHFVRTWEVGDDAVLAALVT